MAILHVVSQSPAASSALHSCLVRIGEGDSLLLIEDGVYAATDRAPAAPLLAGLKVYALEPDLAARGLQRGEWLAGLEVVDYGGFVDLALAHAQVLSWN